MLRQRITPFQYKPIRQGENIEVYASMVDDLAKDYDTNQQDATVLKRALSSIQTNKEGQQYLNKITENVHASLDSLSKTVQGTTRWDLASNTINELTNKLLDDKMLQAIKLSQKNHEDGLKVSQEIAKKGETPINLKGNYDKHKFLNADGTVNPYEPQWQPKADYEAIAKDITKDLPSELKVVESAFQDVPGLLKVEKTKQAVASKINELLPEYINKFKSGSVKKVVCSS